MQYKPPVSATASPRGRQKDDFRDPAFARPDLDVRAIGHHLAGGESVGSRPRSSNPHETVLVPVVHLKNRCNLSYMGVSCRHCPLPRYCPHSQFTPVDKCSLSCKGVSCAQCPLVAISAACLPKDAVSHERGGHAASCLFE